MTVGLHQSPWVRDAHNPGGNRSIVTQGQQAEAGRQWVGYVREAIWNELLGSSRSAEVADIALHPIDLLVYVSE